MIGVRKRLDRARALNLYTSSPNFSSNFELESVLGPSFNFLSSNLITHNVYWIFFLPFKAFWKYIFFLLLFEKVRTFVFLSFAAFYGLTNTFKFFFFLKKNFREQFIFIKQKRNLVACFRLYSRQKLCFKNVIWSNCD